MAKKTTKPAKKAGKAMTADDHRRIAEMHHAKGSIHRAKADLLDAQNPSKKRPRSSIF